MRTLILVLSLVLLLVPATLLAKTFGQGVHLAEETAISSIIDDPAAYVGQKVKISGLVIDVCSRRGCWVYLAGDREFDKIRVKVTDGEIVFPMAARGKQAVVEGVVESMELTKEEVIARRKHHAEETGQAFDPASVTSGETILRIRGLGAEIPSL
jgi:cytochrome c-type biogenesis protein CcmE